MGAGCQTSTVVVARIESVTPHAVTRLVADEVWIDFRMWGGLAHYRYQVDVLGRDAHGLWLGSRKGRPVYKGGILYGEQTGAGVILIPADAWWAAMFRPGGYAYVDVATPAVWSGACCTMVDLDLDVVRRDGRTELVDVEEFGENRVTLNYPPDVAETAWSVAHELLRSVEAAVEPFGTASEEWIAL